MRSALGRVPGHQNKIQEKKMKTFNQLRSLLFGLALIGVSTSAPRAQADQDGTKPVKYRGSEVVKELVDPGTWNDDFLNAVRAERGALEDVGQDVEIEGWINGTGRCTAVNHQIVYFTSLTTAVFYHVSVITSANGDEIWSAGWGSVDFVTGEFEGEWIGLGGTGRFSGGSGGGTFAGANDPETGLADFEAIGGVSTVGSNKR